jgi:aryl-alcohol dehydrogenase-like predicted oxidoreductase
MEYRSFGKTGLQVSALGFGCGNVGGLMVRGSTAEQEQAVAGAMELGINYFDTAAMYGDGQSEQNLGRVLKTLRTPVYVGTKFRLGEAALGDIPGAIQRALEASLQRLAMERVDLLQLHNHIVPQRQASDLSVQDVLGEVVPTLQTLRQQGKIRFFGITGLGDTRALHQVIDAGVIDTVQVCYNLLNPSAGFSVPAGFPAQDFQHLFTHTQEQRLGVIGIRALAAGALSGTMERHPIAVPSVAPIASGPDYATDVQRAQVLQALVQEGHVESLVEASMRFAISTPAVSTALLGYSSFEHLQYAAACIARGPLPAATLERLTALWQQLAA